MIHFKEKYKLFSDQFDAYKKRIELADEGLEIVNCSFQSDFNIDYSEKKFSEGDIFYHEITQQVFKENGEFSYPVFKPVGAKTYSNGIILLHGLNEKSWDKYFVWASYLVKNTGKPVIMFPLAYHINRAPMAWSDRRYLSDLVSIRKKAKKQNQVTFANAALSIRLENDPELFFYSGLQSYCDVCRLVKNIKSGSDTLFEQNAKFDFFSYSIGAFLSEILFLSNPENLFSESKLFIFCGGTTFDNMQGISKYIMDARAFKSLAQVKKSRRVKNFRKKIMDTGNPDYIRAWNGLYSMMYSRKKRKERERKFKEHGSRIYAVALKKDQVMPLKSIIKTLKGKRFRLPVKLDVIDFPYDYTHENPFPVNDEKILPQVNRCFDVVFTKAVNFYKMEIPKSVRTEEKTIEVSHKIVLA